MSEEQNQPPIAPAVRFGLRSMVAATSIAAIFAAAGAPLSWNASEAGQRHLAIAWSAMLASVVATYAYYFFRTRRLTKKAGEPRFFGTTAWENRWSPEGSPALFWIGLLAYPGLLYLWFGNVVESANRPDPSFGLSIWIGFIMGFMIARAFRQTIPWPIAVTEAGIVEYEKFLPWERFSRMEQLADRPDVVRLHRLHRDYWGQGDVCIQFAADAQAAAITFLHERISTALRLE